MELRHLRCFLAVAQELHFGHAAEKLHMEQSPLSRAIKELEEELGVQLFVRTSRSTRPTRAGKLFLEHVQRVFAALEQARESVKAAANGFHSQLGVRQIDEQADTDEPSYFKQTSKKTTLLIGAASEVFVGNGSIKYQSTVTCQQLK